MVRHGCDIPVPTSSPRKRLRVSLRCAKPDAQASQQQTPVGLQRTIHPHDLDERYIEVLKLWSPITFKYVTIPWLHYLSKIRSSTRYFESTWGTCVNLPTTIWSAEQQKCVTERR